MKKKMTEGIRKKIKDLRLKINKIGSDKRAKELANTDFSIISDNCFAGIVYQHLGLKYNTPTVGLYFFSEEYIKFLKKFDYYIKQDLKFIPTSESKYYNELKQRQQQNVVVGKLDDIEIVFLHYKTEKEAYEKWTKRVKRLSKNLLFKFNDQNLCNEKLIKEFDKLPYKNKVCFCAKKYNYKSCIQLKKYAKYNEIKEDYYSCYKYFNIKKYLIDNFSKNKNK